MKIGDYILAFVVGCLMASFMVCHKASSPNRISAVLHERNEVSTVNAPGKDYIGNIDIMPVIFNIQASEIKVWVKSDPGTFWEEIEGFKKDVPTFVLDTLNQQ